MSQVSPKQSCHLKLLPLHQWHCKLSVAALAAGGGKKEVYPLQLWLQVAGKKFFHLLMLLLWLQIAGKKVCCWVLLLFLWL
jgi:hypothetical protein